MKDVTWHTDEYAKRIYEQLKRDIEPIIANICPSYELSHVGFNRNFTTEEVVIKLHLNQIGIVKVAPRQSYRNTIPALGCKGEKA